MLRIILGIAAGVAAALISIMAIEALGHQFYPLPPDLSLRDTDGMSDHFSNMPAGAHAFVVAAWFLGAFVGGLVGKRISGRWWTPWVIAGFVAVAGIVNIIIFPHPVWMQLAAVLAPLLGGLAAVHLMEPRRGTPATSSTLPEVRA